MELTRQKYGYKLQVGGHDLFLTEQDIAELQQLIGGTRPQLEEYQWLTYEDLDGVTPDHPLTLSLAPEQKSRVCSTISLYQARTGRRFSLRVIDERYVRERCREVRRYVLSVKNHIQ